MPDNGKLTPMEAHAILEADLQTRLQQYTDAMNKLSEEYRAGIEQTITLPGGEIVGLISYLKSLNVNVITGMRVIAKG